MQVNLVRGGHADHSRSLYKQHYNRSHEHLIRSDDGRSISQAEHVDGIAAVQRPAFWRF